jgi:hypothetical protein
MRWVAIRVSIIIDWLLVLLRRMRIVLVLLWNRQRVMRQLVGLRSLCVDMARRSRMMGVATWVTGVARHF